MRWLKGEYLSESCQEKYRSWYTIVGSMGRITGANRESSVVDILVLQGDASVGLGTLHDHAREVVVRSGGWSGVDRALEALDVRFDRRRKGLNGVEEPRRTQALQGIDSERDRYVAYLDDVAQRLYGERPLED